MVGFDWLARSAASPESVGWMEPVCPEGDREPCMCISSAEVEPIAMLTNLRASFVSVHCEKCKKLIGGLVYPSVRAVTASRSAISLPGLESRRTEAHAARCLDSIPMAPTLDEPKLTEGTAQRNYTSLTYAEAS